MLDKPISIAWSVNDKGEYVGKPLEPLPEGFELILSSEFGSNAIASLKCSPEKIRLYLPFYYAQERILFQSCEIEYHIRKGEFFISPIETLRLFESHRCSIESDLTLLRSNQLGCFGKITKPQLSDGFLAHFNQSRDEIFVASDLDVWLFSDHKPLSQPSPPSHLVFHGDEFPSPLTITVEPTTACNFRCGFCYGRHLKQGVMKYDEFCKMLENLPELTAVEFVGEGEPLMNKDTPRMIRECKKRNMWVHLTSNGSNMDDQRAQQIINLGIDSFAMSTETMDAEKFPIFRPRGKLHDLEQAAQIMRTNITKSGRGPVMRLWVSLIRDSLNEIENFISYGEGLGFDIVEFQTLNSLPAYKKFYPEHLEGQIPNHADVQMLLADDSISERARATLKELSAAFSGKTCSRFMGVLAPSWQGELSPCILLKVPDFNAVGNLFENKLRDIWENKEFKRFRFALNHGVILNSCEGCVNINGAKSET